MCDCGVAALTTRRRFRRLCREGKNCARIGLAAVWVFLAGEKVVVRRALSRYNFGACFFGTGGTETFPSHPAPQKGMSFWIYEPRLNLRSGPGTVFATVMAIFNLHGGVFHTMLHVPVLGALHTITIFCRCVNYSTNERHMRRVMLSCHSLRLMRRN